ncbi:hypothetical protein EC950943_5004, partial [Escherichia coli 95.0943]
CSFNACAMGGKGRDAPDACPLVGGGGAGREGVNEVTWLLTLKIVLALTFDEPGEKGE